MLLRTIEDTRKYLPVAFANRTASMPGMETAELSYLLPIIGEQIYDRLNQGITNNDLSDIEKELLGKCRGVVAPFAYMQDLPMMQTKLTDAGLIQIGADNQRGAYKWEYNEVMRQLESRGYEAQERLIQYLRFRASEFPDWTASQYNDANGFGIIRNGADLASIVGLQHPQRCYMLLRPLFSVAVDLYLRPNLGWQMYNALNDRIIDESYTEMDKTLLGILRSAAARYIMRTAALEMNMRFGENGFTVLDGRIKDNLEEGNVTAGEVQLQRFISQMEQTADVYLNQAIDFLNRNASTDLFPEWHAGALYTDPAAPQGIDRRNDQLRGFFVMG